MITALDKDADTQVNKSMTENGNIAYGYSNDSSNESIVQFYFQSVLDQNMNYSMMMEKYERLIHENQNDYVLKLCLQTRDIESGKGAYNLTYYMLLVITHYTYNKQKITKNMYFKILNRMVNNFYKNDTVNKAYGSWKDMKYFLTLFKNDNTYSYENKNMIIDEIIQNIYIPQMIQDRKNMSVYNKITLCGKWLPRESSSKFKWLAKRIAVLYQNNVYCTNCVHPNARIMMGYRKLCTGFNKYLETTQV